MPGLFGTVPSEAPWTVPESQCATSRGQSTALRLGQSPSADSNRKRCKFPELTSEDWKNAVRGRHYRPVKAQITASLDKDVLAWLKS
jgi:uncharacterized protein (DUF4415 family)